MGESEERAVLAGEFEEQAENKRAVEQLHRAACARASVYVQAGSHGMKVVRCMRARLNVWGGARGAHTQLRVLEVLKLGTLSTRRGCSKYSHWVTLSTRGGSTYPAEGLEAEAVGVPCAAAPTARLRKQKVGDGRREHRADREHRQEVCRIR